MGKKKKGQNTIAWNPLQSTTIGQIKQNKYGWIGTLLLFALFIGVVFYLPELFELYKEYSGKNTTPPIIANNNTTNNTTTENDERVVEKYKLADKKSFEFNEFKVDNIRLFGGNFSYKITNSTDAELDLSALDYFFEFYDESGEVIQRIFLTGRIPKQESESYSYQISNASAISEFSLSIIEEKYYTYYDFPVSEDKKVEFTCMNDYRSITYTFEDENLKKAADNVSYPVYLDDYAEKYDYYDSLYNKYLDRNGMDVSLEVKDDLLLYSVTIDYNILNGLLDDDEYFVANTRPRIVKFKMEAMGYSCS